MCSVLRVVLGVALVVCGCCNFVWLNVCGLCLLIVLIYTYFNGLLCIIFAG